MADDEAEVLEREEPPRHPGIGVFSPGHPLKGRVVREEGELSAQQVILQLQDCPLYGQSLFLFLLSTIFYLFFFTHNTISKIKQNKTADTYSTSQGSIKREGEREGQLEHKSYSFK